MNEYINVPISLKHVNLD